MSALCHQSSLQWSHKKRDGVSSHRRLDCLFNHLFRCRSKKTSQIRVTGLCEGNPPVTAGFPSQRASNAENASIWGRHHAIGRNVSWLKRCLAHQGVSRIVKSSLGLKLKDIWPQIYRNRANCRYSVESDFLVKVWTRTTLFHTKNIQQYITICFKWHPMEEIRDPF